MEKIVKDIREFSHAWFTERQCYKLSPQHLMHIVDSYNNYTQDIHLGLTRECLRDYLILKHGLSVEDALCCVNDVRRGFFDSPVRQQKIEEWQDKLPVDLLVLFTFIHYLCSEAVLLTFSTQSTVKHKDADALNAGNIVCKKAKIHKRCYRTVKRICTKCGGTGYIK